MTHQPVHYLTALLTLLGGLLLTGCGGSGAGNAPTPAPETLVTDAAYFDGVNDYMLRGGDLTGAADSKTGIFSAWVRLDAGDGTDRALIEGQLDATHACRIRQQANNKFGIVLTPIAGLDSTTGIYMQTANTYLATATWRHVLMSWNLGTVASHIYINDVSDKVVVYSGDALGDYTHDNWSVGATKTGTLKLNGSLAEVYFAPGQYLDFSIEANRRKFITAAGKPVHLGADGSLPTGTAPIIYHHLDDGEAVANFANNRGIGGNFTITGALGTAPTSPTD
jgi:hypothetical protein